MKKRSLVSLAMAATLVLSACSSTEGTTTIELSNGSDVFVSASDFEVTKQDLLDELGLDATLSALLDLMDYDLLTVELADELETINVDVLEQVDLYKDAYEDFDAFLTNNGFSSEEDFVRYIELDEYRVALAEKDAVVTDEEIQELYDQYYPETTDEDEEVETDEEEEEIPTLEEARDELYDEILLEKTTTDVVMAKLAELRQEAGLVINIIELAELYALNFDSEFATDSNGGAELASTNEATYTIEQVYEELADAYGISVGVSLVDAYLLGQTYTVTEDEVIADIDEFKIALGAEYYPYMAQYGLNNDQEIFDYFETMKLQEAAFESNYPITDETIEALYDEYVAESAESVAARHILVSDEELALELLEELNNAEDKEAKFIELAQEHSLDGSAQDGGDLGSFAKGVMVEEFETAAFALEIGTYTDAPVETDFGFHLIFRYDLEVLPFEDMEEQLNSDAFAIEYTSERLEQILMDLRDEAELTFADEAFQVRYTAIREQILESITATEEETTDEETTDEETTDEETTDEESTDEESTEE